MEDIFLFRLSQYSINGLLESKGNQKKHQADP